MAQAGHSRGATECGRGPGITKRGNSRVSRDPRRFADCLRPRGATRLNENNPSIATPSTNGLGRDKAMVTLRVNGEEKSFDGDPSMPLLWVLRDEIGLTGTKFGCGAALCGACTVHVDGQAVRSCGLQVADAAGHEVVTIEGLHPTGDHPVQKAWREVNVPQCGYCQAGQIMQAAALLAQNPKPNHDQIREA